MMIIWVLRKAHTTTSIVLIVLMDVQFYGYHAVRGENLFDPEWESLPYFVSSRETVFSMQDKLNHVVVAFIQSGFITY